MTDNVHRNELIYRIVRDLDYKNDYDTLAHWRHSLELLSTEELENFLLRR